MTQHYTRNTTAVLIYCRTCGKNTMHSVYDRRVGRCLERHIKDLDKRPHEIDNEDKQEELF